MREWFNHWLDGETDVMENIMDVAEVPDLSREEIKEQRKAFRDDIYRKTSENGVIQAERKGFYMFYSAVAIVCCLLLIGFLLYTVANLPAYGQENPRTIEVVRRYVEQGLSETGAVNIVAGIILDYRAFDTLGESHVLFTALVCVTVLLRKGKNMRKGTAEDYYTIRYDSFFELAGDSILGRVGMVVFPCVIVFGLYVLLNGQNGPGGGFSGGAIIGAAMILCSEALGFAKMDRFLTRRVLMGMSFVSLTFYIFAKGYVFFMGANGLENHIPKGTPGAILSGGLILPLNVAVGVVVACTMFGFYSLFKRGSIGGD